jgi:hypothetical protein
MSAEYLPELSSRMEQAIDELKALILHHYPEAAFRVTPSPDGGETVVLWTVVDRDDLDEVMDVVIDRLVEMSAEEGLPLLVVPQRTPARNEAIWRAMRQSAAS